MPNIIINSSSTRRSNRPGPVVRSVPNIPRRSRSTGAGTLSRLRSDAFTIHNTEQWYVVTQANGGTDPYLLTHTFAPGASGIPTLDALAKIFEQYKVSNVSLEFRSSVGTTQGGNHIISADYNADVARDIKTIESIRPNKVGPAWQSSNLRLHPGLMMKGKTWLRTSSGSTAHYDTFGGNTTSPDNNAFRLYSKVTGTAISQLNSSVSYATIGEVWITYTVVFRTVIGLGGGNGGPVPEAIASALNRARILGPTIPTTSLSIVDAGDSSLDIPEWLEIAAPIALAALALVDESPTSVKQSLNSAYKLAQTAPANTLFTIAQSLFPNWTLGAPFVTDDAKITFTYPDGSPVPPDVIEHVKSNSPSYSPVVITNGPTLLKEGADYVAQQFKLLTTLDRDVTASVKQISTWDATQSVLDVKTVPSDIFGVAFEGNQFNVGLGFPSAVTAYNYTPVTILANIIVAGGILTPPDISNVMWQNDGALYDVTFDNTLHRLTIKIHSADSPADAYSDGDLWTVVSSFVNSSTFTGVATDPNFAINAFSANLKPVLNNFSHTTSATNTFTFNKAAGSATDVTFTFIGDLGHAIPDGSYIFSLTFVRYTSRDNVPPSSGVNIAIVFYHMVQSAVQAANTNDLDTLEELLNQYQSLFPTPTDEANLNTRLILQYGTIEAAELQNKWALATSLL